ncbi:MAG: hypothetical protein ACE5KZ_10375 [Candidatus Scalinduaceae bacterium]
MRRSNKVFVLCFISIFWLMGCTSFTPYRSNYLGTDQVFNKNYELTVRKTMYVGEPMIKVKNYYLSKFSAKTVSPNVDVTIKYSLSRITFYAQEQYEIVGETMVNKKIFYLIKIVSDDPASSLLLISENGEVDGSSIFRNIGIYQKNWFKFKVNPPDAKFIKKDITKVDSQQGYKNYELIYTGKDEKSLHITYREYSPDNLARTAFFQDLIYPSDSKVIRFKDYKILVHDATSESITFTVVEEGLNR